MTPLLFRLSPVALLLSAALLAAPAGAGAQSLVQLYDAARASDATYQSSRAQYDANLFRAEQARAGLLPQAALTAGINRINQEVEVAGQSGDRTFNARSATLNASQPLYRPANVAAWEQGKRLVVASAAQLQSAEQDLLVRLSQAYFDVLAAQDTLVFVRAQKAATNEQLAFAKRNFEVGTSTITDTREAQARYDLVTAQEIAAENDLRVKRIALDTLTGLNDTAPKPLALPAALPELAPASVDAWVQQAEAQHPGIVQARAALETAELETRKAEAGHKPTLDVVASYGTASNPTSTSVGANAASVGTRVNTGVVGLSFNLPLFAGFAVQNRIRETLSLEDKAKADLEAARRAVTLGTRTAYFGVVSGAGQVKALEAAEASSQSALDANKLGYQVGVRINIDVLNAQSQLFQTKRDLAKARYDVLMGGLKLRQANGSLTAADLQPINALLVN